MWPGQHLDFRLLPFGDVREFISVVLSHHKVVVICYSGTPQDTSADSDFMKIKS